MIGKEGFMIGDKEKLLNSLKLFHSLINLLKIVFIN